MVETVAILALNVLVKTYIIFHIFYLKKAEFGGLLRMNYAKTVFSQYKKGGRVVIRTNDSKIINKKGTANFSFSKELSFEKIDKVCIKEAVVREVDSLYPLIFCVSDEKSDDLIFLDSEMGVDDIFSKNMVK